jgi:hypothetical protein
MGRAITDASNIIGTVMILALVEHGDSRGQGLRQGRGGAHGGWLVHYRDDLPRVSLDALLFMDHLGLVPVAQ